MPCKVLARQTGVAQAELFVGHVGVFFEVLQSGKIKIGDKIKPL
jgi:MOSC domain-containing protein YiiM